MLDERKIKSISLIAEGRQTMQAIADEIGVSRNALYLWRKDKEYSLELDNEIQNFKLLAQQERSARAKNWFKKLENIGMDDSQKTKDQLDALKTLLAYSEGTPTSKLEITETKSDEVDKETIEDEIKKWKKSKEEQ
ncbi:phBC6A51 family helix-turn-helix protein [Bacillus safensis]|uniref:phBC6A51 family helix-turn-helix protein n=1 Tax=Bacillus safensis TaxID=561879 RepID=UPI00227FD657|nr:phBC6A51 family helix-turn-helix protein [Bacillus safensis]MCY7479796.1 transposase [Bacillus safensis]MCY7513641.1 transposase [Bacillus safensis]MED0719132.1 phBC6A51 family helix-turn-helix protein [Bacillus safensis]MED4747517.1 phBC6A51 family helix-turn-helix protein [Bacillus safensis]